MRCFRLAVLFVIALAPNSLGAAPLAVDYVDPTTGWEWADLTQSTSLTWNQVDSVCAQDGLTPCSANLGAVELAGWIWATSAQVADLFAASTDLTPAQLADNDEVQSSSSWAPQFLALFSATLTDPTLSYVSGWTANSIPPVSGGLALMLDRSGAGDDRAVLGPNTKTFSSPHNGVWLHRPATVPEPGLLALLGLGVFLARRSRR
ncbi:MAG: PEP-CTERM sorting domain-containing protein [Vicinamibacterales bacterium]